MIPEMGKKSSQNGMMLTIRIVLAKPTRGKSLIEVKSEWVTQTIVPDQVGHTPGVSSF